MPDKAEKERDNIPAFQYSWTTKIYDDPEFSKETMSIRKGMTVSFLKTLIVTSTNIYHSPDFIVKALTTNDKNVELQHTWTRTESSKLLWSGTIAFYKMWSNMKKSADHIVRDFEDIQVVWFPDVVHLLIIAERSNRLYGVGVSTVIIKGRRPFKKEEYSNFKKMMKTYGELKVIKYRKKTTEFEKIAVAEYRFATHAFVAKFHLHGRVYSDIGFLHAEVVMTEKEKTVKNEVMRRYLEHVNSES